jgi:hypothetical protein
MKKQQYIIGLKDGYNLKKDQVLNIVSSAINNMASVMKLKQTKAGCLVIRATEEEAEIIAKNNPYLFVEADVIHEKY